MSPGSTEAPATPPGWGVRALKWVGAATAILSLVLGIQQLSSRIRDSFSRTRETATLIELARAQASRREFPEAWKSLDRAGALKSDDSVDTARVEIGTAWLEDGRPGPGQPFSVITDPVIPVLDRALLTAQGAHKADLLALLGWATFLRSRDGVSGDPASRYREALSVDPVNPLANAMLAHWEMWGGGSFDSVGDRFNVALRSRGPERAFVRQIQVAALANRQRDVEDLELIRVASDMRRGGEPLSPDLASRFYQVFSMYWGPNRRAPAKPPLVGSDLVTTFDWIVTVLGADRHSADETAAIRASLQRAAF